MCYILSIMKIAYIVDSSCGLTKKEVNSLGWYFLPLFINIDGVEYADGIDIDSKKIKQIYTKDSKVSTSATPIGMVEKLLDQLTKNYDRILIYPISQHLSSQYQNISMVVKKYKNVNLISSYGACQPIVDDLVKIEKQIKTKKISYKRAVEKLGNPKHRNESQIYLIPKYKDALLNGGRLTPLAAKIANLLQIIPIINFENGALQKFGKGRVFDKTCLKTLTKIISESEHNRNSKSKNSLILLHMSCTDLPNLINRIEPLAKENNLDIKVYPLPPVISIHTGLESFAFYIQKDSEQGTKILDKFYL